jgi:hypothetical protein
MLLNLRRILGACSAALLLSYPLFCQTFAAPKNYGPFTDSFQLKAGDFNRDGAADLIGAANFNNGTQTHLVIYMNNGSGGFLTPAVIAGTTSAFAVSVGDFNQDGNLDVAFASGTSAQVMETATVPSARRFFTASLALPILSQWAITTATASLILRRCLIRLKR